MFKKIDEFNVLRKLIKKPTITQRELAQDLNLSLGKINYCLKALNKKGLVKFKNFKNNPNKFSYKYKLNTFKQFVYENSSFKYLSEEYKQNYWNNCVKYLENLTRFTNYEVLLKLMENYKKWDITGLSMTFIRIVSFNNALKNEPITQQFIKLLLSIEFFNSQYFTILFSLDLRE